MALKESIGRWLGLNEVFSHLHDRTRLGRVGFATVEMLWGDLLLCRWLSRYRKSTMSCVMANLCNVICRWFPIRRRATAVVVAVIAVPVLTYCICVAPYREQFRAATALREVGATTVVQPLRRAWLRALGGQEGFGDVVEIRFEVQYRNRFLHPPATDADLVHLRSLRNLRVLVLEYMEVTDAVLEHVAELPELQRLELKYLPITDQGLRCVEGLRKLQQLKLDHLAITDAGLQALTDLTNLKSLHLYDMPITDAGLKCIKDLQGLQELWVDDLPITDTGLEHLGKLTHLRTLALPRTEVTDVGVAKLQEAIPSLRVIR